MAVPHGRKKKAVAHGENTLLPGGGGRNLLSPSIPRRTFGDVQVFWKKIFVVKELTSGNQSTYDVYSAL
jgi:hypothetical protein